MLATNVRIYFTIALMHEQIIFSWVNYFQIVKFSGKENVGKLILAF